VSDDAHDSPPWLEALVALSLSVAGLSTTWSSYQSALWDGEQASHYSLANASRIEATKAAALAGQEETADVLLFSAWLDAAAGRKERLQDFYRVRFRPEFKTAFEAWLADEPLTNPKAQPTPFATKAYRLAAREQAEKLDRQGRDLFERGQRDNDISDLYTQATVILASSMFFAGICQTFRRRNVRICLAVLASLACLGGLTRGLTLPVLPLPIF
jgi:hypothetical protein